MAKVLSMHGKQKNIHEVSLVVKQKMINLKMKLLLISLDTELNRNTAKNTDIHITVQGPRSWGGGEARAPPPPNIFKIIKS